MALLAVTVAGGIVPWPRKGKGISIARTPFYRGYGSNVCQEKRSLPHLEKEKALASTVAEVELGFDNRTAFDEAERCLNCDVQTVFTTAKCIECDACMDICPTDCINFIDNAEEPELRQNLAIPATLEDQDIYVSDVLPTTRIMAKDENLCLHCGLCAERCPTSAWDMQKFYYSVTKAGQGQENREIANQSTAQTGATA